jgi:uncharacterized protein involved in outer membrane biogenesis
MPVPPSLRPSAGLAGGFVRMTGSGRSLRDILAGANGEAGLFLERGELTELVEQVADFAVLQGLGLMGKSNEPVPINCLVAGFDIRAGVATAKTAVLDTADTLIVGKGNFNFDAETVYLDLTPYHKRARLFTLGAPVEVRGTLAKPELDLEKTGLAQQLGAALGLGVLIPGLGAILPFVDTGLGPQNACRRSLAAFK